MVYSALVLVFAGVCLIFFGAKVFFGVIFTALGLYILVEIFARYTRSMKRTKQTREAIRDRLRAKLDPEELKWVEDIITPPLGKKFLILVDDDNDSTHVRVAIPFSLVIVLKPFLRSISPFFVKFFKDKVPLDEKYLQILQEVFVSCIDELMSFSGDFMTVESKGTTVRIGIV